MCVLFPYIPQIIGSVGRSLLVYNATNAFITFVQSETDLHIQNHTALQKPKNNINNKRHFTKKRGVQNQMNQRITLHYLEVP